MDTIDLLHTAPASARALTGASRATWSRWMRGRSRVPTATLNLLRILISGELPQGGATWAGWRFQNGRLFDPAGQWHTPASIEAWHWTRQELQDGRATENASDAAGVNVVRFPGRRSAHAVTAETYRRLDD